jgi:hypothetical protein
MTTSVEISKLRPTVWYLERKKLEIIREVWRRGEESLLPPKLVTNIENNITLIDGHCRAYIALINGATYIHAFLKNISKTEYNCCLFKDFNRKCIDRGILTIQDLETRIFDPMGTINIIAPTSDFGKELR